LQACSVPFNYAREHRDWVERAIAGDAATRAPTTKAYRKAARRARALRDTPERDKKAAYAAFLRREHRNPEDDGELQRAEERARQRARGFVEDVAQRQAWWRSSATPVRMWHVTNREYRERCGFVKADARESERRSRVRYASAVRKLGMHTKRTCDPVELTKYASAMARHFARLKREFDRVQRRAGRWMRKRRTDKTQDRLAWRLLGMPGRGFRHREHRRVSRCGDSDVVPWSRTRWEREKPIVVFGDGSWSARAGTAPMPRKALIKRVSTRGVVLVEDEFRTSKMCPCFHCGGEMRDDLAAGARVRRCSNASDGGAHGCGAIAIDRDWSGSMGILHCGLCALRREDRPPKYTRATRADENIT
jgi:hypothetical protein